MPDLLPLGSTERRQSSRLHLGPSPCNNSLGVIMRSSSTIDSSSSTPLKESTKSTPRADTQDDRPEPSPSKRPGLRIRSNPVNSGIDLVEEALKPLTGDERRNWKGWVDFDSDPVSQSERKGSRLDMYRLGGLICWSHRNFSLSFRGSME